MAALLQKSFHQMGGPSQLEVHCAQREEEGGFEFVTPRRRLIDNLPKVDRSEALCQLDWELHFDSEGKCLDLRELKEKIFRGGVEHEIRSEVWKFLLGFYDWNSNAEERVKVRNQKVV